MSTARHLRLEHGFGLSTFLDGVRADLGTDTAVMLLIDPTGSVLEPVAASGLDITVRTGARVPIGHGFAGAIAASGVPRTISEVTDTNVVNPMLRRRGLRSLLGVPLHDDGAVIGVLHVGSTGPRVFGGDDVRRLTDHATELARQLSDRTVTESHTAARVLQRSLIPTLPPPVPGLDVAGRYVPAEGDLGGDWYDVFTLPDGRVGLVMGDVLGHGLEPAVVMGRIRSALRAYALTESSPAEVLKRLDANVGHFEPGVLATVVLAISAPPYDSFVISSAGHWPPLVGSGTEPAVSVPLETDPMLGLFVGSQRSDTTVVVPPGGSLSFFTDGLIERRFDPDASVDPDRGLVVLGESLVGSRSAEAACVAALSTLLPDEGNVDDAALLVVRRPD